MAQPVVTTRILRRLLKTGAHFRAEKMLERIHPADLGPLLADLTPDEIRIVVDLLFKHRRAATTFALSSPPSSRHRRAALPEARALAVTRRGSEPTRGPGRC